MTRYWAMRTYCEIPDYFFKELKQGRMRQGWGWLQEQDLRKIRQLVQQEEQLAPDQKDAWKGRRLLESEPDGMQIGDIVILPNLPKAGYWSIVKVTGNYYFEIDAEQKDFGHIRPVELLNSDNPINPYSRRVSALLRGTFRTRNRLWNIDWYKDYIEEVIKAIEEGINLSKPEEENEKLLNIYLKIQEKLYDIFWAKYRDV